MECKADPDPDRASTAGDFDQRAREYSPRLGRFLQRDLLGYPDGMNTYAAYHVLYGGVDPSGELAWKLPLAARAVGGFIGKRVAAPAAAYVTKKIMQRSLNRGSQRFLQQQQARQAQQRLAQQQAQRQAQQKSAQEAARRKTTQEANKKCPTPSKGSQQQMSKSEVKKLEEAMKRDGDSIHNYKGKGGGKKDFYKDKNTGDIYEKPKGGSGPGEPTGYNVRDL